MEQFNVIYNTGSEVQLHDRQTFISQGTKILNRQVFRMHVRHIASWLSRGAVIVCLFYLGKYTFDGVAGVVLVWIAACLLAYLLLYISKGHRGVHRFRQARIYWLLDDATHSDFISDTLSEDSPEQAQEPKQPQYNFNFKHWFQDQVLS